MRLTNLSMVASVVLVPLFAAGCGAAHSRDLRCSAAASTIARISIVIPAKSSSSASRVAKYVSAATQSMTLNLTPQGSTTSVAGFPQTVNLTPTSTGCASTLASTQCNISLAPAPGSYDTTVTTYDQTGGARNVLALGGIAASVAVVPDALAFAGNMTYGLVLPPAASGAVSVFGVDADGNDILGAGAPAVSLTTSDGTVVSVGSATVASGPAAAQLIASATPVSGSGGSAVSASV